MDFQTRPMAQVLADLLAKLDRIPARHPDRPILIRMILDLRREIERRLAASPAPGDC